MRAAFVMATPLAKIRVAPRYALVAALMLALPACTEPDPPTLALYPAVERGDLDQIDRHIHWGTDINALGPDGRSPLHSAAEAGRLVITRLLLDNRAEIDALDDRGHTPFYLAIMAGRTQVADLLIERGARFEPTRLVQAAVRNQVGDRDVIRFLAARGADLNALDDSGETPLILATRLGDRWLAKLLIAEGADVNTPDADGRSPLAWAKQTGTEEIVRLLLRNGAIPDG
jgi:ankyrin repeat protein